MRAGCTVFFVKVMDGIFIRVFVHHIPEYYDLLVLQTPDGQTSYGVDDVDFAPNPSNFQTSKMFFFKTQSKSCLTEALDFTVFHRHLSCFDHQLWMAVFDFGNAQEGLRQIEHIVVNVNPILSKSIFCKPKQFFDRYTCQRQEISCPGVTDVVEKSDRKLPVQI
jgi:hypothetical protein